MKYISDTCFITHLSICSGSGLQVIGMVKRLLKSLEQVHLD